ncbi:PepSY domain-containing protein [Vagococcus fluvialis]|uniref:PepSY domain-containing protein n=1 Tax=Vagococcus fluvialis TaxID=2738 RepID=UPI0037A5AE85
MKKILLISMSGLLLSVMVGCTQKVIEKPVTEETKVTATSEQTDATSGATIKEGSYDMTKVVPVTEIIEVYKKEAPDSDITSIDLDYSRAGLRYKVEGVDNETEYEIKINAETKQVEKTKQEKLDREDRDGIKRDKEKLDLNNILSIEKVTELAETEAKSGKAVEWNLDRTLNVTYWEVKVKDGNKETEIKLDAKSGEVLEVEIDD